MTHNHHSVLLVEGEDRTRKTLNHWLHEIEDDIDIDEVETTAEAKVRLRSENHPDYDLIVADEFLPGLNTGLELSRHCASVYPDVPVLVLDPKKPLQMSQVRELLDQKPVRQHELERDSYRTLWATILMCAGLTSIMLSENFQNAAEFILKNPPFTERFVIPKATPLPPTEFNLPKEELLVPPPEKKDNIKFDVHSVVTQELKAEMTRILANADEIIDLAREMTAED
jgi:CheY-like chemotaxis protein